MTSNRSRSWIALLSGPVIGMTYFLVVYLTAETACSDDVDGITTSVLRIEHWTFTAIAFALILFGAFQGYGLARRSSAESADPVQGFMGSAGLILSGMFAFLIVLIAVPAIGSTMC